MKVFYLFTLIALFIITPFSSFAQNTEEKPKSTQEMASEEADRLQKILNLEDYQVFFVDSTLQHDIKCMMEELETMQKSGMQDFRSFQQVQEKWMTQFESAYKKIFTPEQWDKYLKSTGKLKKNKQDEKRALKEEKARLKQEKKAK